MSTLTTIMQRAGLLTTEECQRIADHCRVQRRAPFVAVVELGFATEGELVQLMHNKLMVPIAGPRVLRLVDPATLAHLPAELAWTHAVLPVSVDDLGNLTLAMADPTDEYAVQVVAAHTGAYVIRAVAPVDALRHKVEESYGAQPLPAKGPPTPLAIPAVQDANAKIAGGTSAPSSSADRLATTLARLAGATDRDEIMQLALDELAASFERVILFIHLQNQLRGKDARGSDLLVEAVTQVRIPSTGPSVFSDVIHSGAIYMAPWPTDRAIDRAFSVAMGHLTGPVLVLPVRVRDKTPILLFGSGAAQSVDGRALAQLAAGARDALERLIFRRKSNAPSQG